MSGNPGRDAGKAGRLGGFSCSELRAGVGGEDPMESEAGCCLESGAAGLVASFFKVRCFSV